MKRFGIGAALILFTPLFSLSAQGVDLLWQGETYTPPFYEGRAVWSKQSIITIVAITQGLGDPNSLVYRWSRNGTVLGNVSGMGRSVLKFEDTIFSRPTEIRVEVLSLDETLISESQTTISPVTPNLLIYEKNPLYGYMFHHEVGEVFELREDEVTFSAFSLFSTPAEREGIHLTYVWQTNTEEAVSGHSITYRVPEQASGSTRVNATVSNSLKILPSLNKSFLVQFGNE